MNCINVKQIFRVTILTVVAMLVALPQQAGAQTLKLYKHSFGYADLMSSGTNPMPVAIGTYEGNDATFAIPERFEWSGVSYYVEEIRDLGNKDIEKLIIPSTITSINVKALYRVKAIEMPKANGRYKVENGALIDMQSKELVWCSKNVSGTFVIPSDIKKIGEKAFSSCKGLKSIEIPNSVTTIGEYAFSFCSGLEAIQIPNSVTDIYKYAFYYCDNLRSVRLGGSVKNLNDGVFSGCKSLPTINIPNSVTTIGEYNQEIKGETNVEIIPVSA